MKWRSSLVLLFLCVFSLRCIESLFPYDHSDALYYHLAGAKIWFFTSFHELITNLTSYAQAGIFDYAYTLLFFFKLSLVKTQSLAQFMHFFFSIGLASLFCFMTAQKKIWGALAALAMLTIAKDGSYFLFAKNDGVLALVGLLAAYSVIEKKSWKLVAFLLGILPLIKLSGLYVVVPVSLLYIYINRKPIDIVRVALISGTMLSLALLKNYAISGNPFFPGMSAHFPGIMTPSMIDYNNGFFGRGVTLATLIGLLSDLFLGKVILLFSIPVFYLNWKKKNFKSNWYFLIAVSIFSIYLVTNGGYQAARFFFSCHFLLIFFLLQSLKDIELKGRWAILVLALVLSDGKIDKSIKRAWYAVRDYQTLSDAEIVAKDIEHTYFWSALPIAQTKTYIISDYIAETYYLPEQYILHIPDHSTQADFLYHCEGGRLDELKAYHYAIISKRLPNPCYEKIRQGKLLLKKDGFELYDLL
ncbi:MAG: hypothetical protein ACOYL6_02665 [Bacteriovoracaceae bacterium]